MEVNHWADDIVMHIPSASTPGSKGWVNALTLARMCKLTPAQVYAAIGYLRDNYPDLPLISHMRKGYRFSVSQEEVAEYLSTRRRSITTQLNRVWDGSIEPYLVQANVPQRSRQRLRVNFDRLLQDIESEIAV